MDWYKSKNLSKWFDSFSENYATFKEAKNYRCKIIGVYTDEKTKEVTLAVMIDGIKKQIIPFLPKNLVTDDDMLNEFSAYDVRAITFYAIQHAQQSKSESVDYYISAQEFLEGKTIFIIRKPQSHIEERRTAHELYRDNDLLTKFNHHDLKAIISTAVQEQTMEDLVSVIVSND